MNFLTADLTLFRIQLERWQWIAAVGLGLALVALSPTVVLGGMIAAAVGIAIISQPLFGIVLALFLGPLGGWEGVFIGGPIGDITSGQLIILFTMACWVGRNLLHGRFPLPHTFLNGTLLLWLFLATASLWGARDLFDGVKELLKWLEMLFIIWMVLDLTRDWDRRKVIMWTVGLLLAAGCVQAFWGIFQFAIRGTGPWHFNIFGRFYRATGSFMQPNPYGGYMALNTCLAIGTLSGLMVVTWNKLPKHQRRFTNVMRRSPVALLLTIACSLLAFGLIGSWSRGGWLNFIAALVIFALFMPKDRKRGLTFVLLGAAGLFLMWNSGLIPAAIRERLFGFVASFQLQNVRAIALTPQNFAIVERLAHWDAAISMAGENIWFGVGIGNYAAAYPEHWIEGWWEPLGHAHNIYLNIFAEMGIFGLISYAIIWVPIFWVAFDLTRKLDWPLRGIPLGLLAGYTGFSVHHLLDNLYVKNNMIYLAVTFALLVLLQWESKEEESSRRAAR